MSPSPASAIVIACLLPATPATGIPLAQPPGAFVNDPGDFYYVNGKPVPLGRATSEFVVGVNDATDLTALVRDAPMPLSVAVSTVVGGRRFIVIAAGPPPPGSDRSLPLPGWLRQRRDVWFVSPIYYSPADRVRVIPTDEIIVRTAATTSQERFLGLLKEKGLRQVSRIDGTADQYLLRIESAKNADVLRVARELFDSGLVQWAEPNFIQQYKREE